MPTISDVENAAVYMLDISWDRKTILDLRERAKDLLIIDHHATAEKELGGLDFAIFDMNKSGAVLTWEYFFGRGDK
jgi:nanoRNase/pAp phosphatase (c-di-AMP/oligoRNAs hydrolase)